MRLHSLLWVFALVFLGFPASAQAQQVLLPAGTLLHCTLDEPKFSSATAEVGDPVLCSLRGLQLFDRSVFPRGSYLAGHLEAEQDPGHFYGKGWLKLEFDRIALPNTDLPLPGKIIAVRGYRVNREGKILGHGHAKRDAAEWLFPPLWPWKIVSLPARGPRPELKGEVPVTVRLMEDVSIPQVAASAWRRFGPTPDSSAPTKRLSNLWYAPPAVPARQGQLDPLVSSPAGIASPTSSGSERNRLTLIVLKSALIFAATDYWLYAGRLNYILPSGTSSSADVSDVDWGRTAELNAERGVMVTLRNDR